MRDPTTVDRKAEVWRRLQTVTDPELDEPVTELEFVTRADVDADNCVHIEFRLPTYWCAANFSFLMADDMRNAVKELPWVADISVVLGDHMYADKINAGLARGLTFQETFGAEADGDLDELRRTFLLKAFQRRQAALLAHLIEAGHHAARLVEMTLDELIDLEVDDAGLRLRTRYLERRPIVADADATSRAFADVDGDPLQAETLSTYVRTLRRVNINAEFNSALCRGLLQTRFDTETPLSTKTRQRVEPR
jgi:metal-sulfur cluster biosynthetic enzyme